MDASRLSAKHCHGKIREPTSHADIVKAKGADIVKAKGAETVRYTLEEMDLEDSSLREKAKADKNGDFESYRKSIH